jgi:hypothetical protein
MPEYLIKSIGGGWLAVPRERLLAVLKPRGYGVIEVPGDGDLRLVLGACEMVFSGEEPGWQVWFEGDVEGHDTDALVGQVARQLEEFTQTPTEWSRIG